jgi:uncharacterized OsmC-like protein
VAYRGGIALEDIKVDFEVKPVESPGSIGFGVRELVTLKGKISEAERVRLQRASQFCPVGQALTKGAVLAADQVRWSSGELMTAPPLPGALYPLERDLPAMILGSVHGHYLLDTKEHDESGAMAHEGEVKVYISCEDDGRTSRWTVLGGHSSDGWVPPPFPLAQSGWAASTASTLRQLLPQETPGLDDLSVELATGTRGDRGQSQANAAEGVVSQRTVSRRITVPGTPSSTTMEMVQAALQRDPVSMAYRASGILLAEEVVVE